MVNSASNLICLQMIDLGEDVGSKGVKRGGSTLVNKLALFRQLEWRAVAAGKKSVTLHFCTNFVVFNEL